MIKNVEKVLAYITRQNTGKPPEILVFEHRDFPDAGIQVPAGSVDPNEEISQAVLREIQEESSLVLSGDCNFIGRFEWFRADRNELHFRNVYHLQPSGALSDDWLHSVSGTGEDSELVFRFFWMRIDDAKSALAVDQGSYLHLLDFVLSN